MAKQSPSPLTKVPQLGKSPALHKRRLAVLKSLDRKFVTPRQIGASDKSTHVTDLLALHKLGLVEIEESIVNVRSTRTYRITPKGQKVSGQLSTSAAVKIVSSKAAGAKA